MENNTTKSDEEIKKQEAMIEKQNLIIEAMGGTPLSDEEIKKIKQKVEQELNQE